ncbi:RNA pseudouridine synthase 6 [Citrus sinensis]|uniref:RNA pseudouridine synthase 6 n=1 Tax=Citrus sinensis TaxID=2711 RepID=A0ACB8NGB8_CITSI|nr:RNA pseudouridine synthase 6 [Citrus sinensis]
MSSVSFSSIFTNNGRSLGAPVSLLRTLASTHASCHRNIYKSNVVLSFSSSNRNFVCESWKRHVFTHTDTAAIAAATTPSSYGYPEYHRLLPCPSQNCPPRVEHLVVSEGGPVLEYICRELNLPPLFVADLIHFGAVYYALVCPKPPLTATPEQMRVFKEVTDPSVLSKRSSIKGKTVREAQKTFRITHVDQIVEAGTYLRVHVHPKRFPRCYDIDWNSRIIAVTESHVVLDKPAGTSEKKVKKLYLALTTAPLPVGIMTHYMRPINIAPRLVSEGWYLCQLEVMECKKVPWPDATVGKAYSIEDCGWPSRDYAYECKIKLLTGRTHQVRAQLAACGAPIVGDSMYMPAAIAQLSSPGLNPFGKCQKEYASDDDKEMAVIEWISQHGMEPSVAIGLQACHISWDDGECCYEARSPWWRYSDVEEGNESMILPETISITVSVFLSLSD